MKFQKLVLVMSLFFSLVACEYITEVGNISDKTITVLAPKNGTVIDSIAIFTWEALEEAQNYHLQVAKPSFEDASQITIDTLLEKTNYTKQLGSGNYEWRIRGENSGYVTAYSKQDFIVVN